MATAETRVEKDSMGEMRVPAQALWGAQTQRAVENFPISGIRFPRGFIRAMGLIKLAAARANTRLGLVDAKIAQAIETAAREVADGAHDDHFVLDIFQTGSGTSTNMNANEVIGTRANVLLGGKIGDRKPVHPNDHVNYGQSSNDVIPTAIHVAALEGLERELLPALRRLRDALDEKARVFDQIVKIGRTHLQDATPIRLGQEFSGYASQAAHAVARVEALRKNLGELAIGGTAVGTGINTHEKFAGLVCEELSREMGLAFREADNHFEAQAAKDAVVEAGAALKTIATSLIKIANDIRWLGSGPRCGIGELKLPAVQPGSSIMPGKVNPVMAEALIQVCCQVIGNDAAITAGNLLGSTFDLNVMMPVMAHNLLQGIHIMAAAVTVFTDKCLAGLEADAARCEGLIEQSLAMCTSLAPVIGYDAAAAIAKEAYASGKTVSQVALEKGALDEKKLSELLDPMSMTMRMK